MEFIFTSTLDLMIHRSCCLLLFGVVFGIEQQPVRDVNGSYLCAIDRPTAVYAAGDIVGIPEGVPDVVRCGYVCTGYVNCTSFNHKSSLLAISSGGGSSWSSVCELFTYVPRNCTTATAYQTNLQCVLYQVDGKYLSCQPVCDPKCVSGCDKQQDGKCDSLCVNGWGLSDTFTCQPCDTNCAGVCAVQGAGKCDTLCKTGFGIASDQTCRACDTNCAGGCTVQGAGKCDTLCKTGFVIASDQTCRACGSNRAGGCTVHGAEKCDALCNNGFGLPIDCTCLNTVNLAYEHDTFQVSTYSTAYAKNAVDGDNTTESCTIALSGIYSWWAVDLSNPTVVYAVKVTNDPSSFWAYRLNNFKVGVTNTSPAGRIGLGLTEGTDYTLCAQYCCSVDAGATVQVTCTPSSTLYRYVIIQGTIASDAICLVEVQVF